MNNKILTIAVVAAVATMLVATSALATEDAFADKKKHKYEKSQAVAQANDCGNGDGPFDVFCQNLASQLQGDGNAVIILGAQPSESGDLAVPAP
jgi:uncharacterized membrane protein